MIVPECDRSVSHTISELISSVCATTFIDSTIKTVNIDHMAVRMVVLNRKKDINITQHRS